MNGTAPDPETVRLRRLLDVQDRERLLIAYDIHDGLAQYLTGAILHLEACRPEELPGRAGPEVSESLRLLRRATAEARRLMSGLRPPVLEEGLEKALAALVAAAREDIPEATLTGGLDGLSLPPAVEMTAFRIVQESLTNARRHAAASRVAVSLTVVGGDLHVIVSDDGRGFEPEHVPSGRLGLEGIQLRAAAVGGRARITSSPGTGTVVEAVLPLPAAGRRANAGTPGGPAGSGGLPDRVE
jgi:signal transduction histidine kinase